MATIRNRYSKSLQGLNAQGFFSPTGSNSTFASAATTLEAFLNAGAEGDIGVFDAATDIAVNAASALVGTTKYYFAQIVDGLIKKSVEFLGSSVELTYAIYDAPVIQQSYIGWDGTDGDLNIAIAGGLQEFVARVNEITPANQPFPTIEGRAVVRNSTGVVDYDVANEIVKQLNDVYDYEANADDKSVIAELVSEAPSAQYATAVDLNQAVYPGQTRFEVDSVVSPAVGDYISFTSTALTQPMHKIIDITGNFITVDRPLTQELASGVDVLVRDYDSGDPAKDNVGIAITATAEDVVFSVGVSEDLSAADVQAAVEWKNGSGAAWQVAALEKETAVYAGDTVQNAAFAEDYGQPTRFVNADAVGATSVYDLTYIKYLNSTPSMAMPNENTAVFGYIIIGTIGQTFLGNAS